MTDKKFKDQQIGIGEINTIRQILMGERFENFERELKSLRKDLNQLREEVDTGLYEMKNIVKRGNKTMKMEMLTKIVDLENRIVKQHDKTSQRIKKEKQDHSNKLSKLFIQMGKEIGSRG
jgi:F0F1-type ATP synthase membrane subunit b/b'